MAAACRHLASARMPVVMLWPRSMPAILPRSLMRARARRTEQTGGSLFTSWPFLACSSLRPSNPSCMSNTLQLGSLGREARQRLSMQIGRKP